ncbi:MAG: hypothetical protein ACREP9_22380 [Candidatus Dormibacteraceae bacterium]
MATARSVGMLPDSRQRFGVFAQLQHAGKKRWGVLSDFLRRADALGEVSGDASLASLSLRSGCGVGAVARGLSLC